MSFNRTEDSKEICPRLGLPHQYWPQGNCQYCGELAPPLAAKNSEISRLTKVLEEIADPKRLSSFGDPAVLRDAARAAISKAEGK